MTDTPLLLHPAPRPDWLAARAEPIIDPGLPIIDPHHHLWDRNGGYLLDDLLADLATGHNILSTVFLQCGYAHRADGPEAMRPVGETEFVAGVAAEAARRSCPTRVCEGIVGHADLLLGDAVAPVLEAHIAAAGGRFRGIRHITASSGFFDASVAPPPPGLMADPRFHAGFARLHGYGLGFDAWLYHPQIDELTALARTFPETSVVLDHVGGPLGVAPYAGKRHETFADWRAAMQRLAACPNVSVKLGGLAMLTTGFAFHESAQPPSSLDLAAAWRPFLETSIELFGPQRCMFESNFPVDKGMCSYPVLWNAFKRVAAGYSAGEKSALFRDTAARVYGLHPGFLPPSAGRPEGSP